MTGVLIGVLALLAVVAAFVIVLGGMAWLASRLRRRGTGDSVTGPFEEMWHPAGYRARTEVEAHEECPDPPPSPGDRLV